MSGTKGDVDPKQKYDRFPSARCYIHATLTFEHAWASQGILLWEVLRDIQIVIFKEFFSFINFTVVI